MPLLEWNFYPSVVIGVLCLVAIYLYAIGPLRKRIAASQPVQPRNVANFLLGSIVLFLALVSPLDALSDEYLFSAHMIQHTLMTMVVPTLLLAGVPAWLFEFILRNLTVKNIARLITNPLIAFSLYNLVFAVWHLPVIYDAALENESLHVVEHLSFMVTATIFWWPILSQSTTLPHLAYPKQILYLFFASIPCTILGGILVFAPKVIYLKYANAPLIFSGFTPMMDQQVGAVIMAMAGMLVYLGFIGRAFYIWYNLSSRQKIHSV